MYPYSDFEKFLQKITSKSVLLDKAKINFSIFKLLSEQNKIINQPSPIAAMKARKNKTEIAGFEQAMIKDAVAMLRWNKWLEDGLHTGETITDWQAARKLTEFRSLQPDYMGDSFSTIVGYGANAAVVHFSVTEETQQKLLPEALLLVDSGGQYLDGTTDITRTLALGNISSEEKTDFTLVLKGHIALAKAKFVKGTRGGQLDVLARQFLWNEGRNYGHGTGHGVGHFLCVHEGPASIRPENEYPLEEGMLLSNEPGLYREGKYGIRHENLMLVEKEKTTTFGEFFRFNVVTLYPFDKRAIDFSMLTVEEKEWLQRYHAKVYAMVSPFLDEEEKEWLADKIDT